MNEYYETIGTKLKTGPGEEIYTVDIYRIKRADGEGDGEGEGEGEGEGKGWQAVGKGGLPDSYRGIVKSEETGDQ